MSDEILQIMPAVDWFAAFEDDGTTLYRPLVGWALVREGAESRSGRRLPAHIVGFVAADWASSAEDTPGFLSYKHKSERETLEVLAMLDRELGRK